MKPRAIYLGWAGGRVSEEVAGIIAGACDLVHEEHPSMGAEINQDALAAVSAQFLFSFGPVIVRRNLLDSVDAAINFHTGPPEWPGRGSPSFALLNGDEIFGVTAHLMVEEVDAGPILRVTRFPISEDDDAETLHARTMGEIPPLVEATISDLRSSDWQPRPDGTTWVRKALRSTDVAEAMRIEDPTSRKEVLRKVRAFAYSGKRGPFVELAGQRFWFQKEDQRST